MQVWARHHDFAHLHLAQLDGGLDEALFADVQQAALADLLDENLQFLGGMHQRVTLRIGHAEQVDEAARGAVE